jgi:hypothetical protein
MIVETFSSLVKFVLVMPKLFDIQSKNRQQIRDAVGTVADELERGMDLVRSRIEAAKILARSSESKARASLPIYMARTPKKLREAFREFKICRGLRETRDHFERPFTLMKASVRAKNIEKINWLLHELESDERMIIDEVGGLIAELGLASTGTAATFVSLADKKLKLINDRQVKIKQLARQVHDSL